MFSFIKIKEYKDNKGKMCPYCGKESVIIITKEEFKIINQDRAVQKMSCKNCKKFWNEIYPEFKIEEI